jgi:membrane protease YdiL (CAAX protease family)
MLKSLPRPGFWMAAGLSAVGVGLQMVFAMPFGLLDVFFEQVLHKPPPGLINQALVLGFVNIFAFGGAVALGLLLNRLSPAEAFPLTGITPAAAGGILTLVVGVALMLSELDNVVRWILPVPQFLRDTLQELFFDQGHWLTRLFLLVIVAPVTEELLFRGIILRGLLRRYRPWIAITLSSLLFGVVHLNPWQLVSATLLGIAFGWFYYRTGSIALSVFGHAVANGLVLIVTSFPIDVPGLTGPPDFETVNSALVA